MLEGRLGNQLFIWNFAHILVKEGFKVTLGYNPQGGSLPRILTLAEECKHGVRIIRTRIIPRLFNSYDYLNNRNIELATRFANVFGLYTEDEEARIPSSLGSVSLYRGFFQDVTLVETGFPLWKKEIEKVREKVLKENFIHLHSLSCKNPAIHVRRGDYALARNEWGILSADYYNQGLRDAPVVCCFSDEEITEKFARGVDTELVRIDPTSMTDWQALCALSIHKLIVISNSSFSWWAAFLATFDEADVYMPDIWFRSQANLHERYRFKKFNILPSIYEN